MPSSIVICSDADLTRLADERQQIYNETRSHLAPEQQKELWEDQKAWVRSYAAACGVPRDSPPPIPVPPSIVECFKRAARARASYLREYDLPAGAMINSAAQPSAAPEQIAAASVQEIPLKEKGGIFFIPVQINGAITLDFVIDSGAADVQIPIDVFGTLIRANTIGDTDLIGKRTYILADGSTKNEPRFIVHELGVGKLVLRNVSASVSPFAGDLLLGQSFLSRFDAWTLDNRDHVLKLVEKPGGSPPQSPAQASGEPNFPGSSATATAPAAPPAPQPLLRTTVVCGRPVEYAEDQAGSSTSFLGVWSGHWNNGGLLCSGLIVQKVDSNGAASLIYVYGPSQPGSKLRWKQQNRIGILSGGRLAFRDDQGSTFTFFETGPYMLTAVFTSGSGRLTGSFRKIP